MKHSQANRKNHGVSLPELILSVVLLGISMAIIGELAVFSTIGTIKTSNKVDALSASRAAIDRISADVRHARAFGDYYGIDDQRMVFPAAQNPIHGVSGPPGGAPPLPWLPMRLSETCLILQIPVMYLDRANDPANSLYNAAVPENPRNGFPIMLRKDQPPYPLNDLENLDTVVYQVVPDATRPGEFLLQFARFPGAKIPNLDISYKSLVNPPQTIARGLVGPKQIGASSSDLPTVFTYLGRLPIGITAANSGKITKISPLTATTLPNVLGVAIDLEIKKSGFSMATGEGKEPVYFGIHNESFMRSNRNLVLNNFSN